MARPKKTDKEPEKDNSPLKIDESFYDDLVKDTDFALANKGSLMHSRMKVRTPLAVLNCIYGGGVPLGIIAEISGMPQSGKSTFLYQCMANYQKDYPDGVSIILDMESSMDNDRLEELGVNTSRVLRLPSTSMQNAFANMFKMFNKTESALERNPNISLFIVYDSLGAGGTEKQQESTDKGENAYGAGAMMEEARIVKNELKNVFRYLEKFPMFLGLINQVHTHVNSYGQATVKSGGAFGLKHDAHAHITFSAPKDNYEGLFLMSTSSKMNLEKSKLSPKMVEIPCEIDVTKGGIIDEIDSFVKYLIHPNVALIKTGSWYQFGDYLKETMPVKFEVLKTNSELNGILDKNYRKDDMYKLIADNKELFNYLQIALIEFLDSIYPAQRRVNEGYEKKLISECSYFNE